MMDRPASTTERTPPQRPGGRGSKYRIYWSVVVASLAVALLILSLLTAGASASAGTITTFAGAPLISGPATSIGQSPNDVALGPNGSLYVAVAGQAVVREINATSHGETVVAGDGAAPSNGAHAFHTGSPTPATSTPILPQAITFDSQGDLIIGDGDSARPGGLGLLAASDCSSNCPFGLPSMTEGDIYAIAGGSSSFNNFPGNGESANSVAVEPVGLTTDSAGDIVIAQNGCYERNSKFTCGGAVSVLAAANCSSSCPFGISSMAEGDIYTVAGAGDETPLSSGEVATAGTLADISGVGLDSAGDLAISTEAIGSIGGQGNVFVVAGGNCASGCPFGLAVTTTGDIYNIAGGGHVFPANNEPASSAEIDPSGAFFDSSGDILIGDRLNAITRLIASDNCSSNCPFGLPSMTQGYIYKIAGGGTASPGNGGSPTSAEVIASSFTTDSAGDLLLTDPYNDWVRLIAANSCSSACSFGLSSLTKNDLYTLAGNGKAYSGDGGPAVDATLSYPSGIVSERVPNGSVIVDDAGNGRVALIAGGPSCISGPCGFGLSQRIEGDIYTIAGGAGGASNGGEVFAGQNALAFNVFSPEGLALDSDGDAVFSTETQVVLDARANCSSNCPFGLSAMTEGDLYPIAGDEQDSESGEEGPALDAGLGNPAGAIAIDGLGDLLIGSPQAESVRLVAASNCSSSCPFDLTKTVKGDIYKIAGGGSSTTSGSPATEIGFADPSSIAVDSSGDALVADADRSDVWLIADINCSSSCPLGLASTVKGHAYMVAGTGSGGPDENGVPATSAFLGEPEALTFDTAGDLLITQAIRPSVRLVANTTCSSSCPYGFPATTRGDIYLVAGNETGGFSGDDGPAPLAEISLVEFHAAGLAVESSDNLLIADTGNSRVRTVSAGAGEPEKSEEHKEEGKGEEKTGGGTNPGGGSTTTSTSGFGSTASSGTSSGSTTGAGSKPPATLVVPVKPLTQAQKLAKALKTCKKQKSKSKRKTCEAQAKKRYMPKAKKKEKKR
jgi:hypothetical protein